MKRQELQALILSEISKLEKILEDGKPKHAAWKIRELRASVPVLVAWAADSSGDQKSSKPVDAKSIEEGLTRLLDEIGARQAAGYKTGVQKWLAKFRAKARRACCSVYYFSIWPFCNPDC